MFVRQSLVFVPDAYIEQQPSQDYVEVCGGTKLYYLSYEDYSRLFASDVHFAQAAQRLWAGLFCGDRLDLIFANYPQLRRMAPNHQVWASLAGVSMSTLKRYLTK